MFRYGKAINVQCDLTQTSLEMAVDVLGWTPAYLLVASSKMSVSYIRDVVNWIEQVYKDVNRPIKIYVLWDDDAETCDAWSLVVLGAGVWSSGA